MEAISMLQKTPDFDDLQSIEVLESDFDSYSEGVFYEDIEIECE